MQEIEEKFQSEIEEQMKVLKQLQSTAGKGAGRGWKDFSKGIFMGYCSC